MLMNTNEKLIFFRDQAEEHIQVGKKSKKCGELVSRQLVSCPYALLFWNETIEAMTGLNSISD
jgi:hypothetical protein